MYRNHLNSFDYKYRIDVQPQIQAQSYGHVPCDELDNVPLLRVERCQHQLGSLIYNTKHWRPISDDNPIIGLCET